MMHLVTTSVAVVVVVGGALAAGSHSLSEAGRIQSDTRTVHVSVADRNGSGIPDLQVADLEVKVGGKTQQVVNVRQAVVPLRVAIIVSDAGTGGFQLALGNFMQKLLGHAEFKLVSVIVQPETVVDYSSSGGVLREGLLRFGIRGRQRGAQLMEAIQQATTDVRREGARPVIVVLRVGAEAVRTAPEERRHPVRRLDGRCATRRAVSGQTRDFRRASPASRRRGRGRRPRSRPGARRRNEGIGRPSRADHLGDTGSGARTTRGRTAESVRDYIRAANGRKARRQALRVVEA
jgi:hypothetical protein